MRLLRRLRFWRKAEFSGTPDENITELRLAIERGDQQSLDAMARAYAVAAARTERDLQSVLDQIDAAMAAGGVIHPNWLWRQQRYEALLARIVREYAMFGRRSEREAERLVARSARLGLRSSASLMRSRAAADALPISFKSLSTSAVEAIVGAFRRDAPTHNLFARMGVDAAAKARDAFAAGIANGDNGRVIGHAVRRAIKGITKRRAELIGVTESQRARTRAQIDNYRANSDVVTGWRWVAALSLQTCPACLARHLQIYPLSLPFMSHPGCRCTAVPVLGEDEDQWGKTGKEWFDSQDAADQRRILGPGKLALYRDGQLEFERLAVTTHNEIWGNGLRSITIREIRMGNGRGPRLNPRKRKPK